MRRFTRRAALSCALALLVLPAGAYAAGTGDDSRRTADVPTTATIRAEDAYAQWASGGGGTDTVVPLASDAPYEYFYTPTHLQERDYWCGPASVQTVDDYWGATTSQSAIATWLRTTASGTDFSRVDDALRYFTGKPYAYVGPIESSTAVQSRIEYGLDVRRQPMVGDFNVPASWPYYNFAHPGHIIPIEAFDWRIGIIRLNDPYHEASWVSGGGNTGGHRTYARGLIGDGIYAHWRRAVVY